MRDYSDGMRRVQVRFPAEEYELVRQQARSLGIPIAEVIRRAVHATLPRNENGAWMRFAGFAKSGNPKSNQSIDEIVYDAKA